MSLHMKYIQDMIHPANRHLCSESKVLHCIISLMSWNELFVCLLFVNNKNKPCYGTFSYIKYLYKRFFRTAIFINLSLLC